MDCGPAAVGHLLSPAALREWPLPAADARADKEDRGHVLVVAGSREIPGAAILAATAALRAGAGKLTMAAPASIAMGLALALPESRVIALPETPGGGLALPGLATLEAPCRACSAVLVGPGFMDAEGSRDFTAGLLGLLEGVPVILDAQAMEQVWDSQRFAQPVLLTPHSGEMAHLNGRSKEEVTADPFAFALDMAVRTNAVVIHKGATTFIAAPDGRAWRHESRNAGMATSGSGDVLAGVILGFAARGASLEQAAAWGVVVHAMAGRRLAQRCGPIGFLARELAGEIPGVLRGI